MSAMEMPPLLIFEDGRFTPAEPVPDWYAQMLDDDAEDWDDVIKNAGFREFGCLKPEQVWVLHVNLFIRGGGTFFAEFSDGADELWYATFGWADLPPFLAQYVIPLIGGQVLVKLHKEIAEYLVRNEPGNPEAARRRREWEQVQERKRARASSGRAVAAFRKAA
jgi:hypothetical protein